ncbi:cob(I)yrinic acid a,c-diamide adenosyltransferase [Clostridium gasigenes]|uniref:cob(I)yrinic acid a,c-diamide adenosyltransferase n=1 Tax=Clostridium gasigenes TaxID=94869 RepID=UPI0014384140|nr:cob(I)yrinic acid a,c-diamide adenosyltransferase [Clostridium gasigenes]NKF08641.1 cob(I)yrinic acid a,c-diamide adenosyltransferase [Clostridium gasigenes]QSW18428.1 cob(I)yrinic acid a,c-diamide adenosyltransferase [Clostridium gasigenes]
MKIYTKTGDKGTTALYGGSRVKKDSLRVEAYGTIDEANSFIGLAYAEIEDNEERKVLEEIQTKLFVLGAELASDEKGFKKLKEIITDEDIEKVEVLIDKYMELAGPFKGFVTPGKNKTSAVLHVARTVIRRAERRINTLCTEEYVREQVKMYVNRLSDLLYAIARYEEEK